ncbi:hypothetical protein PCC9214_03457 [Planktothrix tepida]|uniref:PIN domain-containing protein n=1 Tax=Planktothrix tepida PCC 9214 TaxID=671072 RepID=A0A1J1LS37_9CYAN|nr:hypothetical protein [Planktothrix tepida]CAD5965376.1 hypothetical protein PCC9214_03457 [Planktothrix tepida]CUR35006.1 hypothetical protein PL9214650445 [Planktothrix tepida PCC 9214]
MRILLDTNIILDSLLEVCAVNQDILKTALALNLDDFEDAVKLINIISPL